MYERRKTYLKCPTTVKTEIILEKYMATDNILNQIKSEMMLPNCQIESLEIRQNQMNDKKTQVIHDAISQNKSIKRINITKCRLRGEQLLKLCQAMSANQNLEELHLNQLKINKIGATGIKEVIQKNKNLTQLHLIDSGLDCEQMQEICQGIKESQSLEYLDLRNNIFDVQGLSFIIASLKEHMSIKHLYLESMKIDLQEAQMLAAFFTKDDCKLEELVLNEADIDIEVLDVIMEALYKADMLRRLSLSKNILTESICQHLSVLPKRLHQFQSLCLSHCDIDQDALQSLCKGFHGQTTVKYLDLSWNNISSEGMGIILEMLSKNRSLEKLLIQHNYLGEQGAQRMVEALKLHPQMQYLDISANNIGSQGFLYFEELFENNHSLRNLHVRKNGIQGDKVINFPSKLKDNSNLFYLDLKDNELNNEVALKLITLLDDNYFIEDLVISGNNHISQTNKESILEECRKNILIKEFILPHLQGEEGERHDSIANPSAHQNHFKNYNVETLCLKNQSFFRSDFIAKFINMNRHDFHSLSLKCVHFDEHIKDLAMFLKNVKTRIRTIQLDDCDIGDSQISQVIADCKKIVTLRELRLVRMNLKVHTNEILRNLHDHKMLKILDLSFNQIECLAEISELLRRNQIIKEIILQGNPIKNGENLRYLIMGMAQNQSVVKLKYNVDMKANMDDPVDKGELEILQKQVKLNNIISDEILNTQSRIKQPNTVDFTNVDLTSIIEAAIKYFRIPLTSQTKNTILILDNCKINDQMLFEIIGHLLQLSPFDLEELDISNNLITDLGCEHLGQLLQTDKQIKKIICKNNKGITMTGLKSLTKNIRKNTHLDSFDLSGCSISLTSKFEVILDDISQNCSLTTLKLDDQDINQVFLDQLNSELQQNKSINNIIVPTLKELGLKKKKKRESQSNIPNYFEGLFKDRSGTKSLKLTKNVSDTRKELIQRGVRKYRDDLEAIGEHEEEEKESSVSGKSSESELSVTRTVAQTDAIQKLSLRGKNLTSLDFLSKFMRENPNIVDIDIGENPLTDREIQKFSVDMSKNTAIRSIGLEGLKNLKSGTKTIISRELEKNMKIQDMIKKNLVPGQSNSSKTMLNLNNQSIQNVGFLSKFLQGYKDLRILDLTDNKLGNRGAIEVTNIIEQTNTIEVLNLRNNRIGPSGLQHICSALAVNQSVVSLDIRDNMIQDESYKILLAMLYRNETLMSIKYSVVNEENVKRLEKFNSLSHLSVEEIEEQLKESHQLHDVRCWHKICFPIWCWKSFIHDKHEAFRFKYDTRALKIIEHELMDQITLMMYINNFIYYIIMFVCPIMFVNPCNGGLNLISHFIYGIYSLMTIIFEIVCVLKIQRRIQNKNVLKFNKWHFVELMMGQVARFDTYLDVCFWAMLYKCSQWNLAVPIGTLICMNFSFPFIKQISLVRLRHNFNHTLPRIERNCDLSFIRENMLLATVLDSFCIDNNIEVCKKPIPFGRSMAIWTLLTQDGPQYIIHLLFIFVVHTDIDHADTTVLMSLVVSSVAVTISIFNCIMCAPNEFDPIILQIELKRRKEKHGSAASRKTFLERESLKRKITNHTRLGITKTLTQMGRQSSVKQNLGFDKARHIQMAQLNLKEHLATTGLGINKEYSNNSPRHSIRLATNIDSPEQIHELNTDHYQANVPRFSKKNPGNQRQNPHLKYIQSIGIGQKSSFVQSVRPNIKHQNQTSIVSESSIQ